MSINLKVIGTSVFENVSWAVQGIASAATSTCGYAIDMGTRAYNNAGPALQSTVTKIRSLDFQHYVHVARTFAKSDLGIGFGLISASLVCFGIALNKRPMETTPKNITLVALGCFAMLASAAIVIRPGLAVTLFAR